MESSKERRTWSRDEEEWRLGALAMFGSFTFSCKTSEYNGEDRISTLSDELLHHILSFVDTLQVVQTCVLSKRWVHLWRSHTYLDFKCENFVISSWSVIEGTKINFTNFINQVLIRRDNCEVVRLCFDSRFLMVKHSLVGALIYYAVKRNVKEILINGLLCDKLIVLPNCFSNCKSLKRLKLKADPFGIDLPKSLGLSFLKTFDLVGARDFDGKIFSNCPNLEYLKIEDICLNSIGKFYIHALKLERLEILNWKDDNIMDGCKAMIFAPKLTHFKFKGNAPIVWSEVNLTSLVDVGVDLRKDFRSDNLPDEDELEQLSLNAVKMLDEFQNAESLTLSFNTIEILSKAAATLYEDPSPFTNLKYLKLRTDPADVNAPPPLGNMKLWNLKLDPKDVTVPVHILNYFLRSSCSLKICLYYSRSVRHEVF